eukprot:sb/3470950/
MWYCPHCKAFKQASKKLDLWRLPKVLVIHLKRFSYSRQWRDKIETLVKFPLRDLSLNRHLQSEAEEDIRYELRGVVNHYGGLGGTCLMTPTYHPALLTSPYHPLRMCCSIPVKRTLTGFLTVTDPWTSINSRVVPELDVSPEYGDKRERSSIRARESVICNYFCFVSCVWRVFLDVGDSIVLVPGYDYIMLNV